MKHKIKWTLQGTAAMLKVINSIYALERDAEYANEEVTESDKKQNDMKAGVVIAKCLRSQINNWGINTIMSFANDYASKLDGMTNNDIEFEKNMQ